MNRIIFIPLLLEAALSARSYVYLDVEGLYLQRGGSTRKQLVTTTGTATDPKTGNIEQISAITSKKLVHTLGWEPGLRVSVGASSSTEGGMFRALATRQYSGHKTKGGPNNMGTSMIGYNFPFNDPAYAPGYTGAYMAEAKYKNTLAILEGYFTRDFTPLWEDYFAFRGFLGLQYFYIPEKVNLAFSSTSQNIFNQTVYSTNTYKAKTQNNLGLAALGLMIQIKPYSWLAMELIGYAGVGGSYLTSKTNLGINNNTQTLRSSYQKACDPCYSFMGTVRAVYRPTKYFEIGAGYELIYASGVALAYKQMSDSSGSRKDNRIHHNSNLWYQGASIRIGIKL